MALGIGDGAAGRGRDGWESRVHEDTSASCGGTCGGSIRFGAGSSTGPCLRDERPVPRPVRLHQQAQPRILLFESTRGTTEEEEARASGARRRGGCMHCGVDLPRGFPRARYGEGRFE